MYTKYEEMRVIKETFQNFADGQKILYTQEIAKVKEDTSRISSDINSERALSAVENGVGLLRDYMNNYHGAMSVVAELNKATMCYEQAYTPEQLQPGGIAEAKAREGNRIFYDIRTQNPEYKRIMEGIAYDLYKDGDPMMSGVGKDFVFDGKADELKKDFEAGKITKDQLIYYTNMCWALTQNKDYIEHISQPKETKPAPIAF